MTTPLAKAIMTIIRKDLRTELRSRELVNAMLLFSLLSILVFSFALDLTGDSIREEVISGVLWVTMVYASILGLNRSMATEKEQGCLDAMMISPISRVAIFIGKFIGNFLFTLIIGLLLLPLMTVLYNVLLAQVEMALLLVLGTFGLTSIGTLLAAMSVQTRARETMLPIAMMPMALPILMTVIDASNDILNETSSGNWISVLILIDLVYFLMGSLLFEFVIED
jgi:heme exporter protein B